MGFSLPEGMLLGVSSASAQIEGGEVGSCWNDWFHKGRIHDGSDPAVADDHYVRWQEDTAIMQEMGMEIARFGVEWARLFPREGVVDEAAIAHYREEIKGMLAIGVKPLLTIHHFSDPMWFVEKGGFLKRENLQYYFDLVQLVAERFSDLVSEFIPINEPNVYAANGYAFGLFPPGHKSYGETFHVLENMAYCHIHAYEMLHSIREGLGYSDTMVGTAVHMRVFDPENAKNPFHRLGAKISGHIFQGALLRASLRGRFALPLVNRWGVKPGEYADFVGVNYYTRSTVKGVADGVKANSPRNDLDWEIYPEGIARTCRMAYEVLPRPIYITENGTADTEDAFRARYLYEHLKVVAESGLPIRRYYHWCFLDNWEWLEGESARFGLVHVDYRTQKRTIKASGLFYMELIKNHGVTDEMYDAFVKGQQYRIQ